MTNDISGLKAKLNFSNTIIIPLMLMGFYFAMLGHIKSKANFKIYFITLRTKNSLNINCSSSIAKSSIDSNDFTLNGQTFEVIGQKIERRNLILELGQDQDLTKIRPLKIKLRETAFSKIVSVDNAELIPGQMSFTLRE